MKRRDKILFAVGVLCCILAVAQLFNLNPENAVFPAWVLVSSSVLFFVCGAAMLAAALLSARGSRYGRMLGMAAPVPLMLYYGAMAGLSLSRLSGAQRLPNALGAAAMVALLFWLEFSLRRKKGE